jgi:AraC-like DNA-binding protein
MKAFEIFTDIIINAGIAQGFLIAILFGRAKNINSRFLLILLLIDLSLIVFRVHYLMYFQFDKLGSQFFLTGPFMLLLGPFLFFYLRGIVQPEATITKKDIGHFAVCAVYLSLIIPMFFLGKESHYAVFIQRIIGSPWIFLILQFGYYLVQANRLVKMHQRNIVERFSNVEGMDVSWLKLIVWVFAIILIFIAIAVPSLIHGIGFSIYHITTSIFFSLILFFIAYKGIQQRVFIEPIPSIENDPPIEDSETIQVLKEKLLVHMEADKPFLNPELTLADLAKQVAISRNQLSLVINAGIGDNFYNFINKFRVEEVKELIKKDKVKKYTILALANDAGFNSKSSFNHIFKKATGLTPSEYRDGQS